MSDNSREIIHYQWMTCFLVSIGFLSMSCHAAIAAAQPPPVRTVYFVPSDRNVIPGYAERIDRVMTEIQKFYRHGMTESGYGPMTFTLDKDANGKLHVPVVKGESPMHSYGRNDGGKVRAEVKRAFSAKGLDIDQETVVIFQVLLETQGDKSIEIGPYCGGGNNRTGTAWVYDDARLDPAQLGSMAKGGYYNRPCTIGEFNSHYIGGVAHELGHAFGLPHIKGPRAEPRHALMGDGNHTYGQELRISKPGTYLHPASAMTLSHHLRFAGPIEGSKDKPFCKITAIEAKHSGNSLVIRGQLDARPPVFGIAAYNDLSTIKGDYDAVGWAAPVDSNGNFQIEVGEMKSGRFQLRLRSCHNNGGVITFPFDYNVNSNNEPETYVFPVSLLLARAGEANKDRNAIEAIAAQVEKEFPQAEEARRKLKHMLSLLEIRRPRDISIIHVQEKQVAVSDLKFSQESVGWGKPLYDSVLKENNDSNLISVGGKFHEKGIFAHAPARHVIETNMKWKRFSGSFGLQDNHEGSVIFIINGDGKELFRSQLVNNHQAQPFDIDITVVKSLELLVDNGGDGSNADWGIWIEPTLKR